MQSSVECNPGGVIVGKHGQHHWSVLGHSIQMAHQASMIFHCQPDGVEHVDIRQVASDKGTINAKEG